MDAPVVPSPCVNDRTRWIAVRHVWQLLLAQQVSRRVCGLRYTTRCTRCTPIPCPCTPQPTPCAMACIPPHTTRNSSEDVVRVRPCKFVSFCLFIVLSFPPLLLRGRHQVQSNSKHAYCFLVVWMMVSGPQQLRLLVTVHAVFIHFGAR